MLGKSQEYRSFLDREKNRNFQKTKQLMSSFIATKTDTNTLASREARQRNVQLKNTFQPRED